MGPHVKKDSGEDDLAENGIDQSPMPPRGKPRSYTSP